MSVPPSPESLAAHVSHAAERLARELLEKAFLLRELWNDPTVPGWAKAAILAALAYLLCPLDAVPDLLPGGFADDLAALAALLSALAAWTHRYHRDAAREAADRWLTTHPEDDP